MITILLEDDEGKETETRLPSEWTICRDCAGEGKHDHPAFAGGLTYEAFDGDPEFRQAYFAGRYDVTCQTCTGAGKVKSVATEQLTPEQRATFERWTEQEREAAAERAVDRITRRLESGGA